ncbi:hypothetical protein M0R45_026961 [Rubus argutus]|uniref:Fatty acyl-CoA reductase n=1 Tax=Rubus argutus TaxID=59490 RepID=A0AAW1WYZ0_RUBAR
MAELVKKSTKSDLAAVERNIVKEKLKKLKAQDASEKVITNWMKDLGTARAKSYGWPNTYVFTKSMGEIYLRHSKATVPITIIRPTVVIST